MLRRGIEDEDTETVKTDKLGNKGKRRLVAKWRHGVKDPFCCYCTNHHCTFKE